MFGLGTAINVVAILLGGGIGALAGNRLRETTRNLVTDVLGLVTTLNGAMSAAVVGSAAFAAAVGSSWTLFVVLAALLAGGAIGTLLGVGFVTASLIFCIGPLAIMGAFDDAMGLGYDKLLLKSVLDFFAAMAFAASFGWGVSLSALPVGVYQGLLTVVGLGLGNVWDRAQIDSMTAVGGLLLVAIGLKLLKIKEIAIGDLLPALFVAPLLVSLVRAFA